MKSYCNAIRLTALFWMALMCAVGMLPLVAEEGTGLTGFYYANEDFTSLSQTRIDPVINFDWSSNGPGILGLDTQRYSVMWQGKIQALTSETYTFITTSDDGVELWVNGVCLVTNMTIHPPTENSGTITLVAGQKYDIMLKFFQQFGGSVARLEWQSDTISRSIVPQAQLFPYLLTGNGTGLRGTYYPTMNFTGQSVNRLDPVVDFAWGSGPGLTGIGSSHFSAIWQGKIQAQVSETYTFTTLSDDGIALTIDGKQIIDNFTDHAPTTDSGSIELVAGQMYDIELKYYQNEGGAVARLLWSSPSTYPTVVPSSQLYPLSIIGTGTGLTGLYYPNQDFSGNASVRIDPVIDFTWSEGPGVGGIGANHYSVVWEGQIQAPASGSYTFYTTSDDGVELSINGTQLINNLTVHAPTTDSGTIDLIEGQKVNIAMRYFQNDGGATVNLEWSSALIDRSTVSSNWLYPTLNGRNNQAWTVNPNYIINADASDQVFTVAVGDGVQIVSAVNGTAYVTDGCGVSECPPFQVINGSTFAYLTGKPGVGSVRIMDNAGNPISTIEITVVQTDLSSQPIADEIGYKRRVVVNVFPASAAVSFVSSDPTLMTLGEVTRSGTTASFDLTILQAGDVQILAEIAAPRGITPFASRQVDSFTIQSDAQGTIDEIQDFPDGSILAEGNLGMRPLVPNLLVSMTTFSSGLTFDDGSVSKEFPTNAFVPEEQGFGYYTYHLVRTADGYANLCHTFVVTQNGIQVSQ